MEFRRVVLREIVFEQSLCEEHPRLNKQAKDEYTARCDAHRPAPRTHQINWHWSIRFQRRLDEATSTATAHARQSWRFHRLAHGQGETGAAWRGRGIPLRQSREGNWW